MRELHGLVALLRGGGQGVHVGGFTLLDGDGLVVHPGEDDFFDARPLRARGAAVDADDDVVNRLRGIFHRDEGGSLTARVELFRDGFAVFAFYGNGDVKVAHLLPVNGEELHRVIKPGAHHQLVAGFGIRCAPTGVQIAVHCIRGSVPTLVVCVCRRSRTCQCGVITAEVFELPVKIKAFSLTGHACCHAERYQGE